MLGPHASGHADALLLAAWLGALEDLCCNFALRNSVREWLELALAIIDAACAVAAWNEAPTPSSWYEGTIEASFIAGAFIRAVQPELPCHPLKSLWIFHSVYCPWRESLKTIFYVMRIFSWKKKLLSMFRVMVLSVTVENSSLIYYLWTGLVDLSIIFIRVVSNYVSHEKNRKLFFFSLESWRLLPQTRLYWHPGPWLGK